MSELILTKTRLSWLIRKKNSISAVLQCSAGVIRHSIRTAWLPNCRTWFYVGIDSKPGRSIRLGLGF